MPQCVVCDFSHWNEITSFDAVRESGVQGVILKFSQGSDYRDPAYAQRASDAVRAGLHLGRYHFGDGSDVQAQVANFLDGWRPDELLALDWEDNADSQMTLDQALEFVLQVQDKTGVDPVLYSGNTLKEAIASGGDIMWLQACRLWLAQYGPEPDLPDGWDDYWLWQYTPSGSVPGVTGDVDCNDYQGTAEELAAEWAGSKPSPAMTTISISVPAGVPVRISYSGSVEIEQA